MLNRGEPPYADFSVLMPYGRRSQKHMKARNFNLQPDAFWKTAEIRPPTFEAWQQRWRVYRTILLMIKRPANTTTGTPERPIMTAAALEEYVTRISDLNAEFPEAWHFVASAEDRCRGEIQKGVDTCSCGRAPAYELDV